MDAALFDQIFKKALEVVRRPGVQVLPQQENMVATRIAEELSPVLENLNNREPLWKSRVVRGLTIAAIGVAGGFLGLNISDGDLEQLTLFATGALELGGIAYALYGRITTKPAPRI